MGGSKSEHELHATGTNAAGEHGDPLDFSKKHPVFDLHLTKEGPEFSSLEDQRNKWAEENAGKWQPEVDIPKNWPGLTLRQPGVQLPATRKWWIPTSSYERNGVFNMQTNRLLKRGIPPLFFILITYGWIGNMMNGYFYQKYENNDESPKVIYDKLAPRIPNWSKMWLRPA